MKFWDWYLKISVVSAMIGGSMELFMIKTGFLFWRLLKSHHSFSSEEKDDKVTVLEAEKRAWENSPEAKAVRDALNPWRHQDAEARKDS